MAISITTSSPQKDIFKKHLVKHDSPYVQHDLWNELLFYTDDAFTAYPSDFNFDINKDGVVDGNDKLPGLDHFKLGLFGHDFTGFFEDCEISAFCDL
jgi:hypothetical protein